MILRSGASDIILKPDGKLPSKGPILCRRLVALTSTKQRNQTAARVLAALCAAGIGLGCLPTRADNLPLTPDLNATAAPAFDPAEALCQRQTFLLASIEEAPLWFRYVADLRSGAAQMP